MEYLEFLEKKTQRGADHGFDPVWLPDILFDFQRELVTWSIRKGRAALFEDCGMGKTLQLLVWSQNMVQKNNRPVLILTPLAVSLQTVREAEKFGIEVKRSSDGTIKSDITVTNYERLHLFNPEQFCAVVCDESSILKNFDGAYKSQITEFMRKIPYRLLTTATAAPNDYIELGTSSEALGYLGYMDMLNRFFKNDNNNSGLRRMYGEAPKWRFRGHAEVPFWRWVCSWARAIRKPSDLGFDDGPFILPPLIEKEHMVDSDKLPEGMLFALPASTLQEQREERKRTIEDRCGKVVDLVNHNNPSLVWCHLNDEGDLLEKMIPGAIQISGKDSDESKEEKFLGFIDGQIKKLVIKPKIGAWGLNLQHCNHMTFFPSHSFEQYYQSVRRCWRFGQKNPVTVDIVLTEGERRVIQNQQRKARAAGEMFERLVEEMNNSTAIQKTENHTTKQEPIAWL